MANPRRGEVWFADLDPVIGREQGRRRPVLIVSVDRLNLGLADLIIAVPITSKDKGIGTHVRIDPPEANLQQPSFAMCEAVRSISKQRLASSAHGAVSAATLADVETKLRYLLGF